MVDERIDTSTDKSLSQKPTDTESPDIQTPEQNPSSDSKTLDAQVMDKVHSQDALSLILSQNRKTCSFKGDPELWRGFVRFCEEEYGSVCHVMEPLIKAVVSVHMEYVKKERPFFEIKEMHIERVVQRPRRIYQEPEVPGEARSWREEGSPEKCRVCGAKAFGRGNFGDVLMWLCRDHFWKKKPGMIGWRVLDE